MPRVERVLSGHLMRVDPCQISPFVKITIDAREREVIEIIAAAMYLLNYVFYVKRGQR